MMKRFGMFALLFVIPVTVMSQEKDAKSVAQEVLDKGSALFDTRDAAAMAATYTEDAQLLWIEKDNSTGEIKVSVKKDRGEIESLYRDLFKDATEKTTSKNTVEFAKFVAPDLMVVQGVFQPNIEKPAKFPFVQMRVKQGDKWLMKNLQFYVIEQN
jgi:ketosteroid isomerase-like protein